MRRFEFADGSSNKFWEIDQVGTDLNLRWGRIGTQGQSQSKNFADAAKAAAALDKLVAEKTGKGYRETTAGAAASAAPAASAVKPKPPKPEKAAAKSAPAAAAAAEACVEGAGAEATEQDAAAAGLAAAGAAEQGAIAVAATAGPADASESPPAASPTGSADPGQPPWLAAGEPLDYAAAMRSLRISNYGPRDATPLPSRRFPAAPDGVDPRMAWKTARTVLLDGVIPDLAATDADLQPVVTETWERLRQERETGSAESDALLLALGCVMLGGEVSGSFARAIVAQRGLTEALTLLLQAQTYAVGTRQNRAGDRLEFHLGVTRQVRGLARQHWSEALSPEERYFRTCLAAAPEAQWQECVAAVEAALPSLHPARQVAVALLLPDAPALSNRLALKLSGPAAPDTLRWLQLTATSDEALAALRSVKCDHDAFFYNPAMLATVLQERRLQMLPLLLSAPAYETAAGVLTCIGLPEAIDALAREAGTNKASLVRLNQAAQRWPFAAIAALARLIAAGVREAAQFQPLLSGLLQTHQPSLPSLRPWLEKPAVAVIDRLLAQLAAPADVAADEELPAVLADPPWLRPRKAVASVVGLAPLPLPTAAHWGPGEREKAATQSGWRAQRNAKNGQNLAAVADQLGFDPSYRSRDKALEQQLRNLALQALSDCDVDALHSAWTRLKANRGYSYLYIDGGVIAQLPAEDFAVAVWNRFAGEGSGDSGVDYMLARFGLAAWPGAVRAIRRNPAEFTDLALKFADAELAQLAARALTRLKTLRGFGRDWLLRYPEQAAAALIAPALGKPGEARDCAGTALRLLAANGHAEVLFATAERYADAAVTAALRSVLAEDPLDRFPSKRSPLPAFWAPRGWRRPLLRSNGKALSDAALDHVGSMLAFPATEEVYAGVAMVGAACTPDSLGDFVWDCFNAWLAAGAPAKDAWALQALGWLGNDETARRLTPLIRAWPGEAAHARAVAGLDALAAIGSDVALMLLNGIAQKVKFKGLQDRAREKIAAIAEARGLSTEELEDRLAPDLGLDDAGTLLLDFGPREFRVGFDEALKPYVRDAAGARLADLPKPRKDDDAALAAAAVERFRQLKKDVRTIASQQLLRLETAMCTRRRWEPGVFEQFLAGHPLLRHLVQRLVWGVYELDSEEAGFGGRLLQCFRVAEDGSCSDAEDAPLQPLAGPRLRYGLPHALELPAETAAAFGQLFADYELLQPFAQIGRESFALTDAERAATELQRWKDRVVPTGRLLGLVNRGWRRGEAQDGGGIWYFTKPLDGNDVIELSFEPGIIVGIVDMYPEQKLHAVQVGRPSWGHMQQPRPLSVLDPIVASELIRDLQALCA